MPNEENIVSVLGTNPWTWLQQAIFGQTVKTISAPTPKDYPSTSDAEFARKSEFSYGRPDAAYIEGDLARITDDRIRGSLDSALSMMNAIKTENMPEPFKKYTADLYTKAALVANRSPITALGYDPRQAVIETSGNKTTLGGFYLPKSDQIFANDADVDSLVHESTHRGLQQLRARGLLTKEEVSWLADGDNEELLVRHLMQKYAGTKPPSADEKISEYEVGKKLERAAEVWAKDDIGSFNKHIASIEKKAQKLYHDLYSKGPH